MTNETKKEVIKSFIYGMTIDEISDVYGIEASEVKAMLDDNAKEIAEEKAYRAKLEG